MADDAMLTPNAVVRQLAELGRELDSAVRMLKDAEHEAVTKRHAADLAESHAFVKAEGSVTLRKHQARIASAHEEDEALVAEATVRWLRARIRAITTRIDIGRTMGVVIRAEMALLPHGESA